MNFNSTDYFIVLAEERNFSRAAQRLYITQQSLSAHIASVEAELGCTLVERSNPLELTYAGQVFLKYAKNLHNTIIAMKQEMSDISKTEEGTLRVGIEYSRSVALMPDIVTEFHRRHPKVMVTLYDDSDLQRQLVLDNLDVIVVYAKENPVNVVYEPFYKDSTVMLVNRELLQELDIGVKDVEKSLQYGNLNAMRNCPFIMSQVKGRTEQIFHSIISHSNFEPIVHGQGNNSATMVGLCVKKFGACLIPASVMTKLVSEEDMERLAVFPIPPAYDYQVYFAYKKRSYVWSMVKEFIELSREYVNHVISDQ